MCDVYRNTCDIYGGICDICRTVMRRLQEYYVTFTGRGDVYRIGDELLLQENILMRSTFPQVIGMNVATYNRTSLLINLMSYLFLF